MWLVIELTYTGRSGKAIMCRKRKLYQGIGSLNSIWWQMNTKAKIKKRIYRIILKPVILYDSEVQQLKQKLKANLLVVAIDF